MEATKHSLHKQNLFWVGCCFVLFCFNLWTLFCFARVGLCMVCSTDSTRHRMLRCAFLTFPLAADTRGHGRRWKQVVSVTSNSVCIEHVQQLDWRSTDVSILAFGQDTNARCQRSNRDPVRLSGMLFLRQYCLRKPSASIFIYFSVCV